MGLYFPKEYETFVDARDGLILLSQTNDDGSTSAVQLTVHQFQEIWNREKKLIEIARESE
jgi:hypothetical protein